MAGYSLDCRGTDFAPYIQELEETKHTVVTLQESYRATLTYQQSNTSALQQSIVLQKTYQQTIDTATSLVSSVDTIDTDVLTQYEGRVSCLM